MTTLAERIEYEIVGARKRGDMVSMERLTAILAEVRELERDAARYKKVRWGSAASRFRVKYFFADTGFETVAMESLDEKLDATESEEAILAKTKGQNDE